MYIKATECSVCSCARRQLYPLHTKFWMGIKESPSLSVRLSVRLFTSCPAHNFLLSCPNWIIFYTIVVHYPRLFHDLEPIKVISPRSRSLCTHNQNPYPGHNSSLPCPIWVIFHTINVHDSRLCHDLKPRAYLQGQDHSQYITKILAITPYCHVGSG